MTVWLGCHPKSESHLKSLPDISIENIFQFAGLPAAKPRPVVPTAATARSNVARANNDHIVRSTGGGREDVNLSDFGIYCPGRKILIPLAPPSEHLTGPCWRGTCCLEIMLIKPFDVHYLTILCDPAV